MEKKTIEVSEDLYNAIQKLKEVFKEMTGQDVEKDEDIVAILVGGFIDSLSQAPQENNEWGDVNVDSGIITE